MGASDILKIQPEPSPRPLEVWAGVECTVNRVGNVYYDQLAWNGHETHRNDLSMFAALGIRAMRYPVLWERIAPDGLERAGWAWTDERLTNLRALGVRPIAGLVHHGSGPRYTSLIDPDFPRKLAEYARAVAERYPWLDAYTPINEPLTTARFSGLYGYWYPHHKDPRSYLRILIHEVRGTQLAMQAVRAVNPDAQLVQTDDLGKTYSSPALEYQARHENERRWLAFDLLCGRVDRQHPLYGYLTGLGIREQELDAIRQDAQPPDVLGINYYVTSERYLDDRLELYPAGMHGGNGRHAYVDVEAVRVCHEDTAGHAGILEEAWQRFRLPLALTEVHLGGHREQQLRWWVEALDSAQGLRARGVDIRAITAWALLGSFHWNRLVTTDQGVYESGVFDINGIHRRPTVLARAVISAANGEVFDHPTLDAPGWWRSPQRLLYEPVSVSPAASTAPRPTPPAARRGLPRPVLITGAGGTLGRAFQRICEERGIAYHAVSRGELDIADQHQVERLLEDLRPWAVINAAGYVRVDDAENEPDACLRTNALGPEVLAQICAGSGTALLSFSSDLVFNGEKSTPYCEDDSPDPLNTYGVSKAVGEARVLEAHPRALIVRTSAFFGPWDEANFLSHALHTISAGQEFFAASDVLISPTYVPDLVHASLDLLVDSEHGIWHLANQGEVTWFDFACQFAREAGLDDGYLRGVPMEEFGLPAPRPHYSVLGSQRGLLLPPLENAVVRYVHEARRA